MHGHLLGDQANQHQAAPHLDAFAAAGAVEAVGKQALNTATRLFRSCDDPLVALMSATFDPHYCES